MTIRTDVILDWESDPRVLTVLSPSDEITVQEIVDTLRDFEDRPDGITQDKLIDAAGKEFLGGTTYVGITATLQNCVIAFEARGGPSWELCSISGGNVVAIDEFGAYIDPRMPTAYISVDRTASASATLQEQSALQYASYDGGVTYNSGSSYTGTAFPTGTPQAPVNNFSDALDILNERGFVRIYVQGDATIDNSLDFTDIVFIGESETKTELTVDSDATAEGCEFMDATVRGTLDGNCLMKNCIIGDLNYINGIIEQCLLVNGTVVLGGGADAHFIDCWSGSMVTEEIPTVDMGGSGQSLGVRNYSGCIKIKNLSDPNQTAVVDLSSGMVILDSTLTAGTITVRGVGTIQDNSVGATVLSDDLVNPANIASKTFEENLSGHTTAGTSGKSITDILAYAEFINNIEGGRWRIVNNQMIFYKSDNTTEVARFNLYDSDGQPATENVFERQRA